MTDERLVVAIDGDAWREEVSRGIHSEGRAPGFIPYTGPEHAGDVDDLCSGVMIVPEEDEQIAQGQEDEEQLCWPFFD